MGNDSDEAVPDQERMACVPERISDAPTEQDDAAPRERRDQGVASLASDRRGPFHLMMDEEVMAFGSAQIYRERQSC